MLLAGAVSFTPNGSCRRAARSLADRSARYPGMVTIPVFDDDRVVCYAISPAGQPTPIWSHSVPGAGDVSVLGAPLLAAGEFARAFEPCLSERVESVPVPGRRWVALCRPAAGAGALRLLSDPLGTTWVYIARTNDGYLFGSDFAALVQCLPRAPAMDWATAHAMLGVSYAPDDATCLEGVSVLPGGTLLELAPEGLRAIAVHRPSYGDRYAALSDAQKFDRLDDVFERTVQDWFRESDDGLVLSLSGGNDSRYGLGMLLQRDLKPTCVTFGHPRGADGRRTREMDRELSLGLTRYYRGDVTSWDAWTRSVEQVGTIGGSQWTGWSEEWLGLLRSKGSRVALGFLGDALTGRHLVPSGAAGTSWVDHWERWSLDEGWADAGVLRPEAKRRLREVTRARFDAAVDSVPHAFPHQVALHLDLHGRQRRHVASQLNLMERFIEPVPYFYTDYGIEFWSNLPWDDLARQRLYLAYAGARFPRLFPPARGPRLEERAYGVAVNALGRVLPGVRRALTPPDIDIAFLIEQNRAAFVGLAREMGDAVAVFAEPARVVASIEGFPGRSEMTSFQILRLVNLLLLLRLGTRGAAAAPGA